MAMTTIGLIRGVVRHNA